MRPKPRGCRQWVRRKERCRLIASNSAGDRMSPATPIRTTRAAPRDHPPSSSGLKKGPLDEKARADATAMTRPDVLTRDAVRVRKTGIAAVDVVMAASGCQG